MAINSFSLDVPTEETSPKEQISPKSSKNANVASRRLVKINYAAAEETNISPRNKYNKPKKSGHSPYLTGDALHVVSTVTEKTYMHKRGSEFSSFPLATSLYRANSDELKNPKTSSRKVKKSVLTLPNDPAPQPQLCTVSDINDSEFCNKDALAVIKPKKRTQVLRHKKNRSKFRDFEFYDRDAGYNIDLDCSSTDFINRYKGDGKKPKCGSHKTDDSTAHDVWAVLRNINRFQFRPSPPMSEDSFVMPLKKRGIKRRNRKDLRFVETCHTEQIAYIADFDVETRSPKTVSQSSSFDRITVIEKQNELGKMRKAFEKRMLKKNTNKINNRPRIQNNKTNRKSHDKAIARKSNNLQQVKNKCIDRYIYGDNEFNNGLLSSEGSHVKGYENSSSCYDKYTNHDSNVKGTDRKLELTEFSHSDHSGSSKAACSSENLRVDTNNRDQHILENNSPTPISPQVDEITKVVLNNGRKAFSPDRLRTRIKSRVNTIPNKLVPKMNQTDIKRRVAKLTFPIVILGKDQLSSEYEVVTEDPIQFSGLNEKVWPFMLDWYEDDTETSEPQPKNNNHSSSNKNKRIASFIGHKKAQKITNNVSNVNKELAMSNKRNTVELKNINRNRVEQKRITPPDELSHQLQQPNIISTLQQPPKQKPIRQFKDKMLRLLYKKPNVQCIVVDSDEAAQDGLKKKTNVKRIRTTNVGTDPEISSFKQENNVIILPAQKNQTIVKYSWSKARRASDFIDNVIRKIKSGVYYTYECKASNTIPELKEAAIQTITSMAVATSCDSIQSISKITIRKKFDPLMVIPGFEDDNMNSKLEIENMSMNEIAVKHCTTKILVHFDIAGPAESLLNMKKSTSLIPLKVTESHTKVFKCKTTIVNAMLPEELCTILPNMMTNIIKTNENLGLSPATVDKSGFYNLFPIQEVSRSASPETIRNSIIPVTSVSTNLRPLINGLYSSPKKLNHKSVTPFKSGRSLSIELLPCLERPHFFNCIVNPLIFISISSLRPAVSISQSQNKSLSNTCMALQPYPAYDQRIVPAYKRFDLVEILLKIFNIRDSLVIRLQLKSIPLTHIALNNITLIKLNVTKPNGLEDSFVFDVNSLIDANINTNEVFECQKEFVRKCWRSIKNNVIERNVEKKSVHIQPSVLNRKIKKKGFVKLYRKCKSSSSIAGERAAISLSKINNLEDFFLVFGTGKLLAGAFDRHGGHKILSAVAEMKNWAKELNPRQALLVVLLNNKKDTPNLMRFKPVLLQGIAMNRITRVNELDMEIEVIERENLCRSTQYEGISYLPASAENQDTLFEELCWIAKTTASDYNRTFEESSEKLLKSLLQKRKQLNPSYLRVMARYVGLGLLKPKNDKK